MEILNQEQEQEEEEKEISIDNPFPIIIERHFPTLEDIVGHNKFLNILYYFSPYNKGFPVIVCYFDHKIADMTSTFLITLMYGPILPKLLKYNDNYLLKSFGDDFNYIMELKQNDFSLNN